VLHVIDHNGYVPNASAQNLTRRRSGVISLLVPDEPGGLFSPGYMPTMTQAMIERCNQRGYLLTLSTAKGETKQREFYRRVVRSGQADGLVLLNPELDEPILPLLIKDAAPCVMFGRHAYLQNISWVDDNNREGAHMMVSHLLGLGYRRIAILSMNRNAAYAIDRLDGYKGALVENGFSIDPTLISACHGEQKSAGYSAAQSLLALPNPPDAIFAPAEGLGLGVLLALRERGLDAPRDMGLAVYGDFQPELFGSLGMTTVRQPTWEIASAAIDLLVDRIENPDRPVEQRVFPVELMIRESCRAQ
jgi:LacI family transcriptional regulator